MTKYKRQTNRQTVKLRNKLEKKQKEKIKKVRRAARKTRNSLKAQGIFKVAKKELDIPTKKTSRRKTIRRVAFRRRRTKKEQTQRFSHQCYKSSIRIQTIRSNNKFFQPHSRIFEVNTFVEQSH
jgi:hypothetical protein